MIDVGAKEVTARLARATGQVRMRAETLDLVRQGRMGKGDVLGVARVAAIMAAKRTAEWVPLCHAVPLDAVSVEFGFPDATTVAIEVEARAAARTGVEMEALVAVSAAALTIYDMCKSADRSMVVRQVQLEEKSGGRSGHFTRSC